MPIKTGDNDLDNKLNNLLNSLGSKGADQAVLSSKFSIRESLAHDFSSYKYLFEPKLLRFPEIANTPVANGASAGLDIWLEFEEFVRKFNVDINNAVIGWWTEEERVNSLVEIFYGNSGDSEIEKDFDTIKVQRTQNMSVSGFEAFRFGLAPKLFENYANTLETEAYLFAAQTAVHNWLYARLLEMKSDDNSYDFLELKKIETVTFWEEAIDSVLKSIGDFPSIPEDKLKEQEFGEILPSSYSFEPFLPGSVNFGLQIIFRQGWTPLGTQSGEIVRTLPLGPKQTEKVTIKAMRRTKATRQSEIATSIETATESSAATKDSTEVIQEASEKFNWHAETSASASFGFGSASAKAGAGGEDSASSRDKKTTLNEVMEKTASKIRKDTKIIVSTETEESSELQQVSEITNPNDEIAVTYIYSRLQRQYEIQTYLSEVNAVVFIAEHVPAPKEITGPWIRRHDWIIAQELLDESFKYDLQTIRNYERDTSDPDEIDDKVDENIRRLMETLSGANKPGIPDYSMLQGELPDLFQNQQQAYERELERRRSQLAEQQQYQRSLQRLRGHIFDNILHYCRAIWSSEDPDARLMRYSNIHVPIHWDAVKTDLVNKSSVTASIMPSVANRDRDTKPLSELINTAGPIGFAGNYSIYYLREFSESKKISEMISLLSAPYLKTYVKIEAPQEPKLKFYGITSERRDGPGRYQLSISKIKGRLNIEISEEKPKGTLQPLSSKPRSFQIEPGKPITFDNIRIWLPNMDLMPNEFIVKIYVGQLPILEDPELKNLRWRWMSKLLDQDNEQEIFLQEIIIEMRQYFTAVQDTLKEIPENTEWDKLKDNEKAVIREYYYEYLLRKKYTRKILIDTNNIILSLEVNNTTTLEPFKGLHRILDVLSASEELVEKVTENKRLKSRLDKGLYGDPEVDKVTVVAGNADIKGLAALDNLTQDNQAPKQDEN